MIRFIVILALLRCSGTELTISYGSACNCYHLLISFSVKDISFLSLLTFKKTRVLRPFLHGCLSHIHALGLSFCCLLCAQKWTPEQQLRLDWDAVTLSSGWASPFRSPEIAESGKGIHFNPPPLPSVPLPRFLNLTSVSPCSMPFSRLFHLSPQFCLQVGAN